MTPYVTIAEVNGETPQESGVTTNGMPTPLAIATTDLNNGFNQYISQFSHAQQSITLGIRWDFINNAALKLQYQHIQLDQNSAGRLVNLQPDFQSGNRVNTLSAVIDFVF